MLKICSCGVSSTTNTSLFFGYDFSVQDDFQHYFARMTNKADGFVVLTEFQVSFLGEWDE